MVGADRKQFRFGGPALVDDQRAARRERAPGGRAASEGGAPGIGTSRAPCGASSRGTEPSSPTV